MGEVKAGGSVACSNQLSYAPKILICSAGRSVTVSAAGGLRAREFGPAAAGLPNSAVASPASLREAGLAGDLPNSSLIGPRSYCYANRTAFASRVEQLRPSRHAGWPLMSSAELLVGGK